MDVAKQFCRVSLSYTLADRSDSGIEASHGTGGREVLISEPAGSADYVCRERIPAPQNTSASPCVVRTNCVPIQ